VAFRTIQKSTGTPSIKRSQIKAAVRLTRDAQFGNLKSRKITQPKRRDG
jgi:hypothetical protein